LTTEGTKRFLNFKSLDTPMNPPARRGSVGILSAKFKIDFAFFGVS
jgi:hypothetical protein